MKRMTVLIACRGLHGKKLFSGKTRNYVPFVGMEIKEDGIKPGIGISDPENDEVCFWGIQGPFSVIRAWRTIKYLENIYNLFPVNFYDCWEAASRDFDSANEVAWGRIWAQTKDFDELRKKILSSVPVENDLFLLYNAILNNGIEIDEEEILAEIELGLLPDDFIFKVYAEKELA